MTRERVVEAAVRLADRSGVERLSMPALARALRCGAMTLYGYVANKDDLLDAIAQGALGPLRLPRPLPSDASGTLVGWGRALRVTMLAHPWLAVLFLSRPVIGAGIVQGLERLLGALARVGMEPARGVRAVYAVLTYTAGFTAWELARARPRSGTAYAQKWRRELARAGSESFPLARSVSKELTRVASEGQFEHGLAALAEGLAPPWMRAPPGGAREPLADGTGSREGSRAGSSRGPLDSRPSDSAESVRERSPHDSASAWERAEPRGDAAASVRRARAASNSARPTKRSAQATRPAK